MAALNTATMIVSDAETHQLIEKFKSDFYGADEHLIVHFVGLQSILTTTIYHLQRRTWIQGTPLRK